MHNDIAARWLCYSAGVADDKVVGLNLDHLYRCSYRLSEWVIVKIPYSANMVDCQDQSTSCPSIVATFGHQGSLTIPFFLCLTVPNVFFGPVSWHVAE